LNTISILVIWFNRTIMGKRSKISFGSINGGNYEVIDKRAIMESSQRIAAAMTVVVRRQKKFDARSREDASKLVLNA
jgi:hypothetical protein